MTEVQVIRAGGVTEFQVERDIEALRYVYRGRPIFRRKNDRPTTFLVRADVEAWDELQALRAVRAHIDRLISERTAPR